VGLRGYLLKRLVNTIILIIFVIVLNFFIFELMPGTQGSIGILVQNPHGVQNPEVVTRLLLLYGFCKGFDAHGGCIPTTIWDRFGTYFMNMITFNFGISFATQHPVLQDMISSGRLVNTLTLLGTATVISLIIGVLLGVLVAARRGSFFDSAWVTTSLITYSLPTFFMGLLALAIFAQWLGWFPSGGVTPSTWILGKPPLFDQIVIRLQHLFLPAAVLTLFFYGGHLLITRSTVMESLNEDYIATARAKGLPERTVLFKHALKNASLPIVTNAALAFGGLLGGAIITETVFTWDGLGLWIFRSIGYKDFPVMQAMFYIIALTTIAANFISDIVYGMLDPRIRYE
jgi:ABC-type dipeptide/oligopeptide/nickel transport system permease component